MTETEDVKGSLLTGKEMIMKKMVGGQHDFPSIGAREYRPTDSWLEKKQIENFLEERLSMVKFERIEKLSDLSVAEWMPDVNKAKVVKKYGKHWDVFGHHKDNADWLYPEETLFLIEMNILRLFYAEIPVSIEQAYLLLINEDCTLNEYRVFAHLSKRGYKLVRHCHGKAEKFKSNDSEEQTSSDPDVMIIENTIDVIELDDSFEEEIETITKKKEIELVNVAGSRSWYPPSTSVFSITEHTQALKPFKKSDFFDLGFKTKDDILRLIDRDPYSHIMKPPDQRYVPERIKIKYGMYMLDLKKTVRNDEPSTSNQVAVQPKSWNYGQNRNTIWPKSHNYSSPFLPFPQGNFNMNNNLNNPLAAAMNMVVTAMNMLQPQMNMPNTRPMFPQQLYPQQSFPQRFNQPYNQHYRPKYNKNQYRPYKQRKRKFNRFKRQWINNKPIPSPDLKIVTDYIELDDSDDEPQAKNLKNSKIELVDLSEDDETAKSSNNPEVIHLSDNDSENSKDVENSESKDMTEANETEMSVNETPINWVHFKNLPPKVFDPLLDFDKVVSKESVYRSLQIFEPIEPSPKNNLNLKISYDAYNPTDPFKKSARPVPKLRVIVTSNMDELPSNYDLDTLHHFYDDDVPFLFAVALEESIGYYLFDHVSINNLT